MTVIHWDLQLAAHTSELAQQGREWGCLPHSYQSSVRVQGAWGANLPVFLDASPRNQQSAVFW